MRREPMQVEILDNYLNSKFPNSPIPQFRILDFRIANSGFMVCVDLFGFRLPSG